MHEKNFPSPTLSQPISPSPQPLDGSNFFSKKNSSPTYTSQNHQRQCIVPLMILSSLMACHTNAHDGCMSITCCCHADKLLDYIVQPRGCACVRGVCMCKSENQAGGAFQIMISYRARELGGGGGITKFSFRHFLLFQFLGSPPPLSHSHKPTIFPPSGLGQSNINHLSPKPQTSAHTWKYQPSSCTSICAFLFATPRADCLTNGWCPGPFACFRVGVNGKTWTITTTLGLGDPGRGGRGSFWGPGYPLANPQPTPHSPTPTSEALSWAKNWNLLQGPYWRPI